MTADVPFYVGLAREADGPIVELAGRAYVGEIEDDGRDRRTHAAELAERLRREVERACGAAVGQ